MQNFEDRFREMVSTYVVVGLRSKISTDRERIEQGLLQWAQNLAERIRTAHPGVEKL